MRFPRVTPNEHDGDLIEVWRKKTDAEVSAAVRQLSDYTEQAQAVIRAEVERRSSPEYVQAQEAAATSELEPPKTSIISKAWVFGFVLAIPIVAFGVAEGLQARFTSELRTQAREQFPTATPAALDRLTVDSFCAAGYQEAADFCSLNANLNLMSSAARWSAGVGAAMLLLISLSGFLARRNRQVLLSVFRPGLYATALLLVGLVVVNGALAMASIYYGESALIGGIHVGIILAIGLGTAAGVLAISRNAFAIVQKAHTVATGKQITPEEAPELWAQVRDTANRLGALEPDHLVVGIEPNFYVTEADVTTLSGKVQGRTLFCSLALGRILTRPEFVSILGHELAHFKGEDTKYSSRFYPIYRGTVTSIAALHDAAGQGARAIALLPAIAVMGFFLDRFAVAEKNLSRSRELEADAAGASVTDKRTMATALVKVHAFAGVWESIVEAAVAALKEHRMYANVSEMYAKAVQEHAGGRPFEGIAETYLSHPTDSHPPLAARLNAVQYELSALTHSAADVTPSDAAILLLRDWERHEKEIGEAYQSMLANKVGLELRCDKCKFRVVPTAEGRCPGCDTILMGSGTEAVGAGE